MTAASAMDRMYRNQRHIYDLTRKYYLLGRDRLIDGLAPPQGGSVLEIGCGTGRNLVRAARRSPTIRAFGLDVSEEMLKTAGRNIAAAGLAPRVRLAVADATLFDPATSFGVRQFDRIFISYALSMIPEWRAVLRHAAGLLAPGGSLHIVDFGDQAGLPGGFRTALRAWLGLFHVYPRTEMEAELAAFAAKQGWRLEFTPLYRRYAFLGVLRR